MAEFSTLPALLSQFQLPPAPEVPTTVWAALKAIWVNRGSITNIITAIATVFLAGIAAWQIHQTNKIIKATNEQAKELQEQNRILRDQLEFERARNYPMVVSVENEVTPISGRIELVNIGQHDFLVFGASYVTKHQLEEKDFFAKAFTWIRENSHTIEPVSPEHKQAGGKFYVVPRRARFVIESSNRMLPCESFVYLLVAAAYPNLGRVVLYLPFSCKKDNNNNNKLIVSNSTAELKPLEELVG